jgi:hypothetical protein
MSDQNSPWQVVSESPVTQQAPAQSQPSSSDQSNPWQVSSESPQSQAFSDEHIAHLRALNDARPWWRKMLGLGPSDDAMNAQDKADEAKFWDDQKQNMKQAIQENYKARSDVPVGAVKAAGRSAVGAVNLGIKAYDKVTGGDKPTLSSLVTGKTGHEIQMPKALESDGSFGQEAGGMFEGVLEFISGDAALKSLSVAEKFGLGMKIAKLAEESPAVGKLINMGLNAVRTGVVSGAQESIHGGDTGDVLSSAGTGALTSVASEGLGALAKLAKPGSTKITGETLSTPPIWKGANTVSELAEANQEPGKKVLGNVAQQAADAITQKFGQTAPETISTFHDAAEAVKKAAKPVFEKLDSISKGEFQTATNELNSANKIARRATSLKDLQEAEKAASAAQSRIDDIFKKAAGQGVKPEDLQNARSAWRSMNTLEKVHGKIDAAFNMPQAAADVAGVDRTLDLSKLQGRLNAAFKAIPKADLESAIGKEGTQNLLSISELGADPVRAKTLGEIAQNIGQHLSAGGAGVLAGAAVGHAVPGGSVALAMHFLYSHPQAGSFVAFALSRGLSPKIIVPVVTSMIDSQREQHQGDQ